jgi:hypothetical protein
MSYTENHLIVLLAFVWSAVAVTSLAYVFEPMWMYYKTKLKKALLGE